METSADPAQDFCLPYPGVPAQEWAQVRESQGCCVMEAASWTGFFIIFIFSYENNVDKEVLRDPAKEHAQKCLWHQVGIGRVIFPSTPRCSD